MNYVIRFQDENNKAMYLQIIYDEKVLRTQWNTIQPTLNLCFVLL